MGELHHPVTSHTWERTALWAKLSACVKHDGNEIITVLSTWMPQIEAVLKHGSTAPTDFTLHDEGHAYRLCQCDVRHLPS